MEKSNQDNNSIILRFFVFLFLALSSFNIASSPLIIKGVDGAWLPVLALSWSEKSGGVIVKPAENIDLSNLRKKLSDIFPDMTIEIIGQNLFFPSTEIDSLFGILNGVDTGISLSSPNLLRENIKKPLKKNIEGSALTKDEYVESVVQGISFEAAEGRIIIDVQITVKSQKGQFTRLSGRQKIEILFKMENGIADSEDEKNRFFGSLLFVEKGNKLLFVPLKIEGQKNISLSQYTIKK